ncbi:MAG TPA: mechanosensitive ion channel family protein, partial [Kofleriaceae bacterium]|nr:mechanosensitive ion channel family protein [Kofleriaceae bacterium]
SSSCLLQLRFERWTHGSADLPPLVYAGAVHFWSTLLDHLWLARTPFLVLAYFVVRAVVSRTNVERYHMRAAGTLVTLHGVATVVGAAQTALGYESSIADTVGFAFLMLATVVMIVTLVFRAFLPRLGWALPRILIDLVMMVGVVVVFIAVGKRAGFSVAGLITTSAVLTAVIGLALQDTLGNVMGGLSVQLDKSLKVGDWISLGPGQPTGRVAEIRWRYTAIETRAWDTIIVPNGSLVKSQITIIGRRIGAPLQTRRSIDFYVDFRTSPTEVITAVETALRKDPVQRMALDPLPHVLFLGIRDSFAHYCVRYWLTDLAADDPPDSATRVRIWFALRRANIKMSIPASTVFLIPDTPEREQRKQSEELDRRIAALATVDLFRGLAHDVRKEIAQHLVFTPFAAGEAVCHEGDSDDGLYMIVEGDAIVRIGSGAEEREVARLTAGQFFGEMSLMTGEARTATVVAASDMLCYRIDKPAFERVLRDSPAILEHVADVLAERRTALTAVRDEREDVKRTRADTARQDLIGRIRGFFRLPGG